MTVRYLAFDDYVAIAVAVTGQDMATFVNATNTDLADSALHAPSASFAGQEFYPDFIDKAAVLLVQREGRPGGPDRRGPAARWGVIASTWTGSGRRCEGRLILG